MDEIGLDALKNIGDTGIVGAITVLLIVLIVYREMIFWPREIAKRDTEITRAHEAHDKTRSALLEEVRTGGETLVLVREQLKTQATALDTFMRMIQELVRSRGG